ncbi:MAG: hypothetical protein J0M13_14660 [Candidatus Accumulibacter sp.]|nr:hypothetical protein [Candidatus Accumulibacter necessarius]
MYLAIQLALAVGVERKSWLQLSWEFLVGGTLGAIAGVAFFFIFGAIGFVCGALFGSLGLLSLMLGGALGGLGLGALVNIARDPQRYNFHWPTISAILLVGLLLARFASSLARRAAEKSAPATEQPMNSSATDA